MTQRTPTIIVLISGNGSNLQALIDASNTPALPAQLILVVSNKPSAYGLVRAKNANIPTLTVSLKKYKDAGKSRVDFDIDLAKQLASYKPDLIVLAGWMHILSSEFLSFFPDNIINLHPALPGQFDGAHAIERAYQAFKEGRIKNTGAMIHKVIPEVDRGEVIVKQEIPISDNDSLSDLEDRIHRVEHKLIVEGAKTFLQLKGLV
ncbi:phosphoribosylglycinamide formyltransferase [Paraphysoderma sedebokerense]|nr:phosphoribosylglycinamide formyltransferase [Paraphysoderma sedebokerense]